MAYRTYSFSLIFSAALLFLMPQCGEKDDVAAIRGLIRKGVDHAEKHEADGILKLATEDLRVLPADVDRKEVRRILWLAFRHYGSMKISYPQPGVEIAKGGKHASARFPFLIVKKDQSFPNLKDFVNDPQKWVEQVGESADLYRLKLRLSKTSGEWLVDQAHLERFTGLGFSD